jgi:D-lactate dehydrogenase (cytochrome)
MTTTAPTLIPHLQALLGSSAVVVAPDALATYDADASMIVAQAPQVAVVPASPEQAAAVVRLAGAAGLPVVARGAGTGIAGGAIPVRGGVVLSTARLDQIVELRPRDRQALVQPGAVNAELNARLAPLGMQFAPDPSSQRASTIGGNLATNAGGPHCLKYGVTTNHILAVQIVRPDGSLLWTNDGRPDPPGYDLTGLVAGSEGTFGVVTQVLVRLTPLPEAVRVVLALFPDVVAAASAVSRVIAAGSLPTSLEVMDHNAIRAVNSAYGLGLPEAEGTTLLIIEVDGVADGLDDLLEEILDRCRAEGAFELRPARTAAEQAQVWAARKAVAGAIGRLAPAYYLVDTVVPRTRLPLMLEHVERLRREYGMEVCNVFHAGDGNLHPLVLYDPRDPEQRRKAHAIAAGVLELSIQQGGVISGEHGIGVEKQNYLPLLFSPAELQLHATVHQIFNPTGSFNPAKIFPEATPPAELAAARCERMARGRRQEAGGRKQAAGAAVGEVIAPATLAELAAFVAECHHTGTAVVPIGHVPSSLRHPITPSPCHLVSLHRLTRVLQYEPDDLTIGVEAGMTLAELQATLAANGQMIPLDVADPEAVTIGALVAAAAEGPRRLGYGLLRDWALSLTVVEPDGTLVRLGAQVVKNVTGYDLVKLYVGSRGTLGVIAGVSLKVFPRPQADQTLLVRCAAPAVAVRMLDALAATRLQPTAVEYLDAAVAPDLLLAGTCGLLVRAEGHPAAVEQHRRDVAALAEQHGATLESLAEATDVWAAVVRHSAQPAERATTLIRFAVQPSALGAALDTAHTLAARHTVQCSINARALNGVIFMRATGPSAAQAAFTADLVPLTRRELPARALMRELKSAIDPYGTMNPAEIIF